MVRLGWAPLLACLRLTSLWGPKPSAACTPQAYDILRKLAAFKPDVVLHLGDVYYSGTYDEEKRGVLE